MNGDLSKTRFVGPVSRFPVHAQLPAPGRGANLVVVMNGTGGSAITAGDVEAARGATPDWEWVHLDRHHGRWLADPSVLLAAASVVVTHAGQNAVAEVSALRRPAVIIPQDRPFGEQRAMSEALLRAGLPVHVAPRWPTSESWPAILSETANADGLDWSRWNDGEGAARAADVLSDFEPSYAELPA